MKLSSHGPPHIRDHANNRIMMRDMLVPLSILYFFAMLYYGLRAVNLGLFAMLLCWVLDIACVLLRRRRVNFGDISPLVTGMIIPLLMPASISYGVVAAACIFAICFVKHPFGGLGNNIFNPAAAGVAFAIVCWPAAMFSFPAHFVRLPLFSDVAATLTSNAYLLRMGGVPISSFNDILLGQTPGPMGAANALVAGSCLLFLIARKAVRFFQPLLCLGTVAVLAFLFPRVEAQRLMSVYYELMCTSVVFCAAFMLSDPVTSPNRGLAKAMYGITAGVVIMIFRRYGGYEETMVFALLLCNALSYAFDMMVERWATQERRQRYGQRKELRISEKGAEDIEGGLS